MSKVVWSKEHRLYAKENGRTMFVMGVNSQHKPSQIGEWTQTGSVPDELAIEMFGVVAKMYRDWLETVQSPAPPKRRKKKSDQ